MPMGRVGWMVVVLVLAGACGDDTVVAEIDAGTYTARVPTTDQLAAPRADTLPPAFADLRAAGIDEIGIRVAADEVVISSDGEEVATRAIVERARVLAQEADSGFRSRIEAVVLRLDGGPLEVGGVAFDQPAIVPGRAAGTALVALRNHGDETSIDLGCPGSEPCVLAIAASPPSGSYESTQPDDRPGPVESIEVTEGRLELRLASGDTVDVPAGPSTTSACGITETAVWAVPAEAGVELDAPVVVDTTCLGGAAGSHLTIMERADIPVLAPWGNPVWCDRGPVDAAEEGVPPECFVFARPD